MTTTWTCPRCWRDRADGYYGCCDECGYTEEKGMITKQDAVAMQYRQEIHHTTLKNADGTPVRARVNGQCKTWKRNPERFQVPVKHGLKQCFYLTEDNAHEWALGDGR